MATVNVTKYNPMEMLNKAFNFADWSTAAITANGSWQDTDTTGAREIHIIQTSGTNSVDIKFFNEAGIYPPGGGAADYEFTLASGNLPFVADKMQMDEVSIKGTSTETFVILWYK
jgi:hypothetical protein